MSIATTLPTGSMTGLTAVLAAGLTAGLLAATMTVAAAAPAREQSGRGAGTWHRLDVACFNTPTHWNEALAGPLPRCSRWVR